MQRLILLLLGILWPSLALLVRQRSSLNVVSGRHRRKTTLEEPHVVVVIVLGPTPVILRRLWLSGRHRCCRSCRSHRCLWSSIARALLVVVMLRKLRGRCVLEGSLVVQSLHVDIDSRSSFVLSSYWIRDSIFAVIRPFLGGCWLRILGRRDLGLRPTNVGAGTRSIGAILMIDSGGVRSRVGYSLSWWLRSRSDYRGDPDALQEIGGLVVLLDRYICSVMGLCFSR